MSTNQYGPKTAFADQLHAMKYRGVNEDFRESQQRIAFALKDSDDHYHALRDIFLNQRFMPAGRVQAAMGAPGRKTTAYNCLSGATEILTDEGYVRLDKLHGKVNVLSPVSGVFETAVTKSYGKQKLYRITFSNAAGGQARAKTFTVDATKNHRWVLQDGTVTDALNCNNIVKAAASSLDHDVDGWVHGFVFGDGTKVRDEVPNAPRANPAYAHEYPFKKFAVRLCGKKANHLVNFETSSLMSKHTYQQSSDGDPYVTCFTKRELKELPVAGESPEYITGFVKGLLDADGCFSTRGNDAFSFHGNEETVKWIRDHLIYADYAPSGRAHMVSNEATNYGERTEPLWKQAFRPSTQHKGYRVVGIELKGTAEVYCVEEPLHKQIILRNGLRTGNCFVSGTIEDTFVDKDGIMTRAHEAAATMRMGGGIGYDFSTLRPRGFRVAKIDSQSSGPVSFMPIYDSVCQATSSYGHRRGAQMGVMRVDHPDIEEFLQAKQNDTALRGFNISIAITDEFMNAALSETNTDFDLVWDGKPYKTIDARALWEKIMRSTWDWAEPGVLFIDTINRNNNLNYVETIAATNPCFEAGTLIVTDKGAFPIEDLVGKSVKIHDGKSWRKIDNFRVTGRNQRMVKITMQDGSEMRVTEKHKFILSNGEKKKANKLSVNDKLMMSDITYDGKTIETAAYLKGFLVGDGAVKRDYATLWLYGPKHVCMSRLAQSSKEVVNGPSNTNVVETVGFNKVRGDVLTMTGLTQKKDELHEWVTSAKTALPVRAFSWDRQSKLEFIAGLFDADGNSMDTANGFGYQLSSTHKKLLLDVQVLLKSIGVRSKLGLMKKAGVATFDDKIYETQNCYRLTVSQAASILLSKQINFARLPSFADYDVSYKMKSRAGCVVSVEQDGIDEVVYCCTVPNTHAVALGVGIVSGQCGEQPLPPFGACLLGSFNLTKYLQRSNVSEVGSWWFDFGRLIEDIPHVVRGMDNVVDRTIYPLSEQRAEAMSKRRMGLGVSGLANAVEAVLGGPCYGDDNFIALQRQILRTIRDEAYKASAWLAKEKGAFPHFDADRYCNTPFIKTLPQELQQSIRDVGIRNSHLTSIAPTGTISMTADNISGGVEPVFSYDTTRTINTPDGQQRVTIADYGVSVLGVHGKLSADVTAAQHVAVLVAAQEFVDSAVSKTCNVSPDMPWVDFKNVYVEAWRGGAKGCTTFNSGGKRFALLVAKPSERTDSEELSCEVNAKGERSCE